MAKRNSRYFDKNEAAKEIYAIFKNYGPAEIVLKDYTPEKILELDPQSFYDLYNYAKGRMTNYACIIAWIQKRNNCDMRKIEETLYYSSDEALEDVATSIRNYWHAYEEIRKRNSFEVIDPALKIETDNKIDSLFVSESTKQVYLPSEYVDESNEEFLTEQEYKEMDYGGTVQSVSKTFRCNIVPITHD